MSLRLALVVVALTGCLAACDGGDSDPDDAGRDGHDAGRSVDGGSMDAGSSDAGMVDAGMVDGASPDAGAREDAGMDVDGAARDAGPAGALGDGCGDTTPCREGLVCEGGVCEGLGTGAVGDACTLTVDCEAGAYCSAGTCAAAGEGASGASCVGDSDCTRGLRCSARVCTAPGSGDVGSFCLANAECAAGLDCDAGACTTSVFDRSECVRPTSTATGPRPVRQHGEYACLVPWESWAEGSLHPVNYAWGGRMPDGTYSDEHTLAQSGMQGVGVVDDGLLWVWMPLLASANARRLDLATVPVPADGDVYEGRVMFYAMSDFNPGGTTGVWYDGVDLVAPTLATTGLPGEELLSFLDDLERDALAAPGPEADELLATVAAARDLVPRSRAGAVELGYGSPTVGLTDIGAYSYAVYAMDATSLRTIDALLLNTARSNPFAGRPMTLSLVDGCFRNVGTGMMCVGGLAMGAALFGAGSIAVAVGTPLFVAGAAVFTGGLFVRAALHAIARSTRAEWAMAREAFPGFDQLYYSLAVTDGSMATITDCDPGECGDMYGYGCGDCGPSCDATNEGVYSGGCVGGGCTAGTYSRCPLGMSCDSTTATCR